jgi:hypothetical protein
VSETEFGDPETVTIAELKVDDFVVEFPSQKGIRGAKVNSGIRDLRDDYGTWRSGPPRRKMPIRSRILMFKGMQGTTMNIPADCIIVVRRPVERDSSQ